MQDTLADRCYDYEAVSEPLLLKVARCIPVLSSSYIGKCTARVLKHSGVLQNTGGALSEKRNERTSMQRETLGKSTSKTASHLQSRAATAFSSNSLVKTMEMAAVIQ